MSDRERDIPDGLNVFKVFDDGGTVIYSLLIYNNLHKSFNNQRYSFGGFLKEVFFTKVTANEVDKFLTDTK
jgi:hypothetical protein